MVLKKQDLSGSRFFPSTRYQGSKRKLVGWIYEKVNCLEFDSALDLFGGSGMVGFLFKTMGKRVTYNDYLKFNYYIGKALIENNEITLTDGDINFLIELRERNNRTFIQDNFKDMYYTDEENKWLDSISGNINELENMYIGRTLEYKKALAYYALFQSCLVKRPFNLFHRKNLYLRKAQVKRRFGNKTTWEKQFGSLFKKYAEELNRAVFSNGEKNRAINRDAFSVDNNGYDLIYIDPPYLKHGKNPGQADYRQMYHFLEGLANYSRWGEMIDYNSYNYRLTNNNGLNGWLNKGEIIGNTRSIVEKFSRSIIVMSYKCCGIPSEDEIISIFREYRNSVIIAKKGYNYALNRSNGDKSSNCELLIIGK